MTCELAAVAMAAICCLLYAVCWKRRLILILLANTGADAEGIGRCEDKSQSAMDIY